MIRDKFRLFRPAIRGNGRRKPTSVEKKPIGTYEHWLLGRYFSRGKYGGLACPDLPRRRTWCWSATDVGPGTLSDGKESFFRQRGLAWGWSPLRKGYDKEPEDLLSVRASRSSKSSKEKKRQFQAKRKRSDEGKADTAESND